MIDDITTICVTSITTGLLILFTILDLMWHKRAFNEYREVIWRGFIPPLICGIYLLPYIILGFNIYSLLIFIYFIANILIGLIVWHSEGFYSGIEKYHKEGRFNYYFWFYFDKDRDGQANFFKFKKHTFTLETLVKVIDENKLLERDIKKFKSDAERKGYKKFLDWYENWKPDAKKIKIDTFGFFDITEFRRGYKRVIYVHENPLTNDLIAANCVRLPDLTKIDERKHETIIAWAGLEEREISQNLEVSKNFLDLFATLPMLEKIPIMKAENMKLKALNLDYLQALETHKSLENIGWRAIHGNKEPPPKPPEYKKYFQLFIIAIIGFAAIIVAFICLMAFGVI